MTFVERNIPRWQYESLDGEACVVMVAAGNCHAPAAKLLVGQAVSQLKVTSAALAAFKQEM